ncbi:hypothetical protein C8035_v003896 [Colletotrichum spinosum]|uniref:Heterokaryon incompatibility domain-containing protein n=1 Tax=Colletotrichum spinosum TaxID=1347390 RepID=A0A4V3HQS6_9PEZI|nr:hypothetical protein C8035_v003896 [Colletotrichum spinosum]
MDYLPYPPNTVVPPISVPYLPGYQLDDGDFGTFPERHGLTTSDVSKTVNHQHAALVQEWLFFGMIDKLTDEPLPRSSFVRQGMVDDEPRDIIDASPVTGLIARLNSQLRRGKCPVPIKELKTRVCYAAVACRNFSRQIHQGDESLLSVYLSVAVLCEFLASYLTLARWADMIRGGYLSSYRRLGPDSLQGVFSCSGPAITSMLLKRMISNGWCEYQVYNLECYRSYMVTYYLSGITRKERRGISHTRCTRSACAAYNTVGGYTTRHTEEDCCCEFLGVDKNKVVALLEKQEVPLISMTQDAEGNLVMDVIPLVPEQSYTAISHVWIDGLGNDKGNALPHCQLTRLFQKLTTQHRISKPNGVEKRTKSSKKQKVVLWMDSLCIPVSQEHHGLRMKAINLMAFIYSAAEATLVLDDELLQFKESHEPHEALLARCLVSKWNSRCWTLQEGMLSRHCLIQFGDCRVKISTRPAHEDFIPADNITSWLVRWLFLQFMIQVCRLGYESLFTGLGETDSPEIVLCDELQHACRMQSKLDATGLSVRYSRTRLEETEASKHFISMWTTLAKRSTTMTDDLHVVLANLTDFKASEIQRIPQLQERTKFMLQSMKAFPARMLFVDGYRPMASKDHPDRWVLATPEQATLDTDTHSWEPVAEPFNNNRDAISIHNPTEDKSLEPLLKGQFFLIKSGGMVGDQLQVAVRRDNRCTDEYLVKCIKPDEDELYRSADQIAFILLVRDNYPAGMIYRGARFLSTGKTTTRPGNSVEQPICRFDCPVTAELLSSPHQHALDEAKKVGAEELPHTHRLVMECSPTNSLGANYMLRSKNFCRKYDFLTVERASLMGLCGALLGLLLAACFELPLFLLPSGSLPTWYRAWPIILIAVMCPVLTWTTIWIVRWRREVSYRRWIGTFLEDWKN